MMNRQSSTTIDNSNSNNDDNWRPVKTKSQNRQSQKLRNGDVNRSNNNVQASNLAAATPNEYAKSGTKSGGQQQQSRNSNSKTAQHNGNNSFSASSHVNHHHSSNSNNYFSSSANHGTGGGLQNGYNDPRKAIEKEIKILSKHEANMKHARWLFEEEMKKSEDRLKRAFNEMRERLNQREHALLAELDVCKLEGESLLANREDFEQRLKIQTARVASMNVKDLEELRQNIRKFMHEKRTEDELGKQLRFQYEPDKLIENINAFGEVQPVHRHVKKSPSVLSLVSGDGGDVSSVDSSKPTISRVNIGGVVIQSDSMDPTQLADLTRQLQENLRLQGITEDILPEVSGSLGSLPQRRRPPPGSGSGSGSAGPGSSKGSISGSNKDQSDQKAREKRKFAPR